MSTDTASLDLTPLRESAATFSARVLDLELFDYQEDFVDAGSARKAAVCGRQVGKTEMAAVDGLHAATTQRGVTVLITAPTQRQSSELFRRVRELIAQSPIDDWGVTRQTQTVIEFETGSRIVCLPTGNDGSTIRGYTADCIIADEAAFIADDVFTSVLLPMLATTNGTLALTSTPFGEDGFLFETAWRGRGDDWTVTHVPTERSPLVDDDFIDEQERTLSQLEFRQEIEGRFIESANAFFPRDTVREATGGAELRTHGRLVAGADLARHGADRTVIVLMDDGGRVSVEVSNPDLSLTEAVGKLRRLHETHELAAVHVDETGLGGGPVEMLQSDLGERLVTGVKFSAPTKQSLFQDLKRELENGELTLPSHPRLRQELTALQYETRRSGSLRIEHPDGGHDDHPDALALAADARRGEADGHATDPDNVVTL